MSQRLKRNCKNKIKQTTTKDTSNMLLFLSPELSSGIMTAYFEDRQLKLVCKLGLLYNPKMINCSEVSVRVNY